MRNSFENILLRNMKNGGDVSEHNSELDVQNTPLEKQYEIAKMDTITKSGYFRKPKVSMANDDILAFICLRNELLRLPYFLEYYRNLGVSHFFVVDNGSDDGSTEFLEKQHDVHLFVTFDSYAESAAGRYWTHELALHYGIDHWCLTLDVDEMFVYPGCEEISLHDLTRYLDDTGATCMYGLFLDMYSDKSLSETIYHQGEPFLDVCSYFDVDGYSMYAGTGFPAPAVFGGPRQREFWLKGQKGKGPAQRKNVLVKWDDETEYCHSTHSLKPQKIADVTSAVLHFKFFSTFAELAKSEDKRGDRAQKADYSTYAKRIEENDISFFCDKSRLYKCSDTLIDIGYLAISEKYVVRFREKIRKIRNFTSPNSLLENIKNQNLPLVLLGRIFPFLYRHNNHLDSFEKFRLSNYIGSVCYFDGQAVGGWVSNKDAPTEQCDVVVISNGKELASGNASRSDVIIKSSLPVSNSCSFRLNIPNDWNPVSKLEVITANGIRIGELDLSTSPSIKGAVDLVNCKMRSVRGWIMDFEKLESVLCLNVFWDGKFVFKVTANQYQEFRLRSKKSSLIASHGFTFVLPKMCFDGKCHELVLKCAVSGRMLKNSPVNIDTATGDYSFYRTSAAA